MSGFTSDPHRNRAPRRRVVSATLAAVCTVMAVASLAGAARQSVVRSVHLLPAGDRASLVIELESKVAGAKKVDVHRADEFIVDIGPVPTDPAPEVLRAGAASPLIREVRVLRFTNASRQLMVRVQVKLQAAATGTVRIADRRVYVDFARASDRSSPPAVLAATTPTPPATVPTAGKLTPAEAPQPAVIAPPPPTVERQLPAPEGEALEAALVRAKTLAQVPDVKGLTALRGRIAAAAGGGGTNATDSVRREEILAQIDGYLAEAQRLQLAKDAELFRKAQIESYFEALRQAIVDLDAIKAALRSPKGPASTANAGLKINQLATRLRALDAPPEWTTQHTGACAAADEAVAVVARTSDGVAATAASEADTHIDRTRAALTGILTAANSR